MYQLLFLFLFGAIVQAQENSRILDLGWHQQESLIDSSYQEAFQRGDEIMSDYLAPGKLLRKLPHCFALDDPELVALLKERTETIESYIATLKRTRNGVRQSGVQSD